MQAPQKSEHEPADRPERRNGPKTRRTQSEDRRNEDRLAEELLPRRNPDVPDRRS